MVIILSISSSASILEVPTTYNTITEALNSCEDSDTILVYRGDYIVPVLQGKDAYTVEVPRLKIKKSYPAGAGEKNYIKMKKTGTYEIIIGNLKGTIEVIEYTESHYKAVSSQEADKIIKNINPLVLDVRTPMEYSRGHLKGSILIS